MANNERRTQYTRELLEQLLLNDLEEAKRLGTPINLPSAPFRVEAEAIAGAIMTGPRRYMVRRRRIEVGIERLLAEASTAWMALADEHALDPTRFVRAWQAWVASVDVAELNKLIDAHNRWYPIEANLPMDVRTRDYITFDGRDYRQARIDAHWLLERFPADLSTALAAAQAASEAEADER